MDRSGLFLARRYAQAFLAVAYDSLKVTDVHAFEAVHRFFKTHQQACFLMDLSLLDAASKKNALMALIERFKLPASCHDFMSLIIAHHRAALLPFVFHLIADLYQKRSGIIAFVVQSSLDLSEEEKTTIENFLKQKVHGQVLCSYVVDPKLIAGVRIFNERYLWECSAQAQLRVLYNSVQR